MTKSRTISIEAEARAIRWAVENGARVINMSLGGIRDPLDPNGDSFSRLEADAVAYAVSNGVVVVAAVGNGDQAPMTPWRYASYPAALPHVLGVSAVAQDGAVPKFSNRDPIYNDISAPGLQILSILPRPLTARFPACSEQGYSSCGPEEYREAQGTSFATPQVSAAAAVLLSLRPTLRAEQVTAILRSSAVDNTPATGCADCAVGRDPLSGWGRLDVAAAMAAPGPLPLRDRYEANDDAGSRSFELRHDPSNRRDRGLLGRPGRRLRDQLKRGQPVYVGLKGPEKGFDQHGAVAPAHGLRRERRERAVAVLVSARPGARQYFAYRAPEAGRYFVQVRMSSPGLARYRLTVVKA